MAGARFTWKVKGEDTGYVFSMYEQTLEPGEGVPLHCHAYGEAFYALSGNVDFLRVTDVGDEWITCDERNLTMSEQAMKELAVKELTPNRDYTAKRFYFDVGIGSICLSRADTGRAYCLLEVGLAPGINVPRHTHTREDEAYFVLAGELEVVVGDKIFVLRAGDTLMAPRDIPHQLRNSGKVENHYLLVFSPSGFAAKGEFRLGTLSTRMPRAAPSRQPL